MCVDDLSFGPSQRLDIIGATGAQNAIATNGDRMVKPPGAVGGVNISIDYEQVCLASGSLAMSNRAGARHDQRHCGRGAQVQISQTLYRLGLHELPLS